MYDYTVRYRLKKLKLSHWKNWLIFLKKVMMNDMNLMQDFNNRFDEWDVTEKSQNLGEKPKWKKTKISVYICGRCKLPTER